MSILHMQISVVKTPPANEEDAGNAGSVPGSRRPLEEARKNAYSSILAWRIPWTEEPGGLPSKELDMTEHAGTHLLISVEHKILK